MPRCQRTFRRLPDSPDSGGRSAAGRTGCWTCPHCADHEAYAVVGDADLLQYARAAEDAAVADFGRPADRSRATLLLYGVRPECVLDPNERRYVVYLQSGSDALQLRLQIGHEVFHRVCSQGRIFHWTHEMVACLFSVRQLRRQGFGDYAAQTARQYRTESARCPLGELLSAALWSLPVYPEGYYGRAYETGRRLEQIVGWPALCRLARSPLTGAGEPNLAAWFAALPAAVRSEAKAALDIEEAASALTATPLSRTQSKWD